MNVQQSQPTVTSRILVLHETDNTAVALTPLAPGEEVLARGAKIKALSPISTGHKIALDNIPAGGNVIRYGEIIGAATASIQRGEHVHVHNLVGKRVGQGVSK